MPATDYQSDIGALLILHNKITCSSILLTKHPLSQLIYTCNQYELYIITMKYFVVSLFQEIFRLPLLQHRDSNGSLNFTRKSTKN